VAGGIDDTLSVVLQHFEGPNTSTVCIDESGKVWTLGGAASIVTAQSKFGSSSGLFGGSGDYFDTPDSADFTMGSGDFTVDCWVRRNAAGVIEYICGQVDSTGANANVSFCLQLLAANTMQFFVCTGATAKIANSAGSITADSTWHHVALIRSGNNLYSALDGVLSTALDVTGVSINDSTFKMAVGKFGEFNSTWNGWIDELRITKGLARWTTNFAVPTRAYTPNNGVIFDTKVANKGSAVTTVGTTHVAVAKADLYGIVKLAMGFATTPTGITVTWGGTTMTLIDSQITANVRGEWIYGLYAPPSGSQTITASWTNAADALIVSESYYGVNKTAPVSAATKASGTSVSPLTTVTSAIGQMVTDMVVYAFTAGDTVKIGADQWISGNQSQTATGGMASTQDGVASAPMAWTISNSRAWLSMSVAVLPTDNPPPGLMLPKAATMNAFLMYVADIVRQPQRQRTISLWGTSGWTTDNPPFGLRQSREAVKNIIAYWPPDPRIIYGVERRRNWFNELVKTFLRLFITKKPKNIFTTRKPTASFITKKPKGRYTGK
jgi:hypothetical protein